MFINLETNGEESVVRKIKLKPVRNRLSLLILSKIKNNFKINDRRRAIWMVHQ
jgi:hypothetical protein